MSSYQAIGGAWGRRDAKLADSTATTVVDGNDALALVHITCTENAGATPTLTIAIVNTAGTTLYLRNALAMTAKQSVTFDSGWPLNKGDLVKVTSSDAAGKIDVIATVLERAPSSR